MVSAPRCPPGAQGLLALLLLLPLPGARGLCGAPPRLRRTIPGNTRCTEGCPIGTQVTYKCLNGDVKIPGKSDTVVCLENSEWSAIGEFCGHGCGAPPRLKSATLSKEDGRKNYCPPGSTVSYVCRPGYESTELRLVITCLENLTWSEAPEFCRAKSCGVPKGPEHGRAVVITNDLFGARANIICDEGFTLHERPFIQCVLKGDQVEWSQLPTCQGIPCKQLELENGRVYLTDHQVGATANFSCNEGYRLIGTTSAQCVVVGNGVNWDKELPHCQAIPCPPPPDITHGSHTGQYEQEFSFGSAVTYKCDQGFSLIGEASIHCTTKDNVNGEWSGPAPECKAQCHPSGRRRRDTNAKAVGEFCGRTCDSPPRLSFAELPGVVNNSYPVGTELKYSCRPGYVLGSGKSPLVTCLANSTWSVDPEICEAIPCLPPPDITSGSHTGQSEQEFSFGSAVTYKCDQGFSLIGEASIHCTTKDNVNGEWSAPAPECKGVCDSPPRLSFAELPGTVNDSYPVGTELKYSCRPGYVLGSGKSPLVTCLSSSTWSVDPEFCVGIPCKQLELENGRVHLMDHWVDATANFSCNEGYRLIGTTSAQCVAVGNGVNWDKELPHCQVIITQDKPTTVPPEGAEVTGTSSVIITQDKPTTVPPERAEVAGTSSDSALNTAGNSAEPEGPGIDRRTGIAGIGPGIDTYIIGIIIAVIIVVIIIVILIVILVGIGNIGIVAALNKIWQKKKGFYSVNPGCPKHQITTEHDSHLNESKCNLIFKV